MRGGGNGLLSAVRYDMRVSSLVRWMKANQRRFVLRVDAILRHKRVKSTIGGLEMPRSFDQFGVTIDEVEIFHIGVQRSH